MAEKVTVAVGGSLPVVFFLGYAPDAITLHQSYDDAYARRAAGLNGSLTCTGSHAGPTTQVRSEARAGRRNSSAIAGNFFRNRKDQQNYFLVIVDTRSQAAHRRNATALVREQDPSTPAASGQSRALEYNVAF